MAKRQPRRTLQARYVFPVDSPPIEDGFVDIEGDTIVAVSRGKPRGRAEQLGNAAILPGLINAHTHLEFSDLAAPLGKPGMAFPDWILAVVKWRRERVAETAEGIDPRAAAIAAGLEESSRAGVALLGEIAALRWPCGRESQPAPRLEVTIFRELLGLSPEFSGSLFATACQHIYEWADGFGSMSSACTATAAGGRGGSPLRLRPGLSPHAPYTVPPLLLVRLARLSRSSRVPLAMHLAECPEELELLRSGSGPLVRCLKRLDAWDPQAIPRGSQPADYLRVLATAHRALVVHGNYLTPADLDLIAAHRDRLAVVYCPRTHRYFGHPPYPLAALLQRGICVAAGTDSRGTNPDLMLLEELRTVFRLHSGLRPEDVLRMGTLSAAQALGAADSLGTLAPGKRAALTVVPLPDRDTRDPHELLLDSAHPARGFDPSYLR